MCTHRLIPIGGEIIDGQAAMAEPNSSVLIAEIFTFVRSTVEKAVHPIEKVGFLNLIACPANYAAHIFTLIIGLSVEVWVPLVQV